MTAVTREGWAVIDQALDRRVAVKVWNARGMKRAQFEAAKIARFNHPLIVTTHRFGRARGYPYCVMELVAGSSGKGWLRENPPVEQRVAVWRLYSKALRFIHDAGSIHGDPHLGNVLVFPDPDGVTIERTRSGQDAFIAVHRPLRRAAPIRSPPRRRG